MNEGDSESEWMSPASYRPLVMEERKSLGTAERIRLTDEILLAAGRALHRAGRKPQVLAR